MHRDHTTNGIAAVIDAATPEVKAMLINARGSLDEEAGHRMKELAAGGLNWAALTDTALDNQVLPLVASNLIANHRDDMPKETLAYLEEYTRGLAARNMLLTAELFRVLDAFAAGGIPAFPYKGPTLAATAYGGVRYRQFGDLDILVPKDHYLQAMNVLMGDGFVPVDGGSTADRRYLGHKSAHAFARDTVHIDLQWGSTYRKALSIPIQESLWESNEEVEVLGRTVRAIPADILFVFLCAHGARHQWDRLKWVCDVAEMIRKHPDLNWTEILRRAEKVGAVRVVHMALLLADSLVAGPVPAWVLKAASEDRRAEELATLALEQHLIADDARLEGKAQLIFTLGTKERARDRVRFVAGILFHPTEEDYKWVKLPDRAWFLYRILRPVRLAYGVATRGVGALNAPHDHG